uniref:Extended synaptotagmin-3-like n=1 Tax=Salarias fasciatus TaxID=181472 RepID=A0A672ICZ3_SALFA
HTASTVRARLLNQKQGRLSITLKARARTTPAGVGPDGFRRTDSPGARGDGLAHGQLREFLMYFGRAVFLFYPVYLTGYLGLSISWVLLCMMMITWYQKNRQWKDARIGSAIQFVDNETDTINEELKGALQMASWVHFTDVEKANWLNKVLEQAWPFFGMYMEKLLKENIQPVVRQSNGALKMFNFTKVHFGHIPPKITGIKAFTHEVDHREVILDMNISYEGDVDIDAEVKPPITAGVKGLKLQGMIRVILEPLIGQAPLVGGVTFFFIRRPTLQINWTGMTNLLDSPAFSSLSEDAIMDIIASLMVLPNRMCIPLIDQVKVDQMRFPLPRGVVRVHLLEARDLVAKDTYMMGMVKGKSDPYATLRVGNRSVKSKTIKENLHPKWGEVYEFVVHEAPGQELEVELFDEDTDKDDFIGRSVPALNAWFPLEGVPYGEIHLKLQWLSLQSDSSLLTEVPYPQTSPVPRSWRSGRELLDLLMCVFRLPAVWFMPPLLLPDHRRALLCHVKEHEKKTQLGVLNIPLTRLLETSDMTLDQRFPLDRSGASSHIKMKVTLRILTVEEPPPKIILTPPPPKAQDGVQNASGGNSGFSSRTVASTSSVPAASSPLRAAYSQNGLNESYPLSLLKNHQGSLGEIELSVRYATLRKKLIVLVNSCRNIFPCSENGTDSYVRMYLLPNQSWIHRKRTHVKKKTVNPVFNDKFEYDVTLEEAQTRMLDVSVKNNRLFHRRERKDIGMVLIDLSQLDLVKGVTQWYTTTLFSLFT